jgi:tetratricopeptide (TPR) repeat protein
MANWRFLLLSALLFLASIAGQAQTAGQPPAKSQAAKPNPETVRINGLIEQSRLATQSKDWKKVEEIVKQLIAERNDWDFYQALGNAQFNLAEYEDAIKTYETGIKAATMTTEAPAHVQKTKGRKEDAIANMLTNEGNAYLKLRKNEDAMRMYTRAAEMDPNPAVAYFNICATSYNTGNMDSAIAACRKSIAADPKKADAYFILGSCLYGSGSIDKSNHFVVPAGTVEALKKYLELAPTGPHVDDVKAMLNALPKM